MQFTFFVYRYWTANAKNDMLGKNDTFSLLAVTALANVPTKLRGELLLMLATL